MDTKKKDLVGQYKNGDRDWRPKGEPVQVEGHDFPGVLDANRLLVTADSGGSHISMIWRGKPLISHEVIVNTIAATTTGSGLRVHAELDTNTYPTGVTISDTQLAGLPITRHDWHGDWNYTLRPDQPDPAPASTAQPDIDRAWLTHPAVTGLQPAAFEELTTRITALRDIQREAILQRRPGEQRKAAPNRRPRPGSVTVAERIATTLIKNRFELPTKHIAALLDIAASSVVRIIAETQPLLTQLHHRTQPAAPTTTATEFNVYLAANGVVP